ncbi:MAG: hypothetical protein JW749_06595 [Sedimentisphaerales bacterium]|nr:hypothetical protein [Sedimentisphaerales bacterium]
MEGNEPKENEADSIIRFACNACGQRIRVPKSYAGKKGKCPKCQSVLVVPQIPSPALESVPSKLDDQKPDLFSDLLLQQPPHTKRSSESHPALTKEQEYQILHESAGMLTQDTSPPPKRKYPWLIDVFLYPANVQGLIFLGIVILVPLAIYLLFILFSFLLGPLALLILFAGVIANIVLWMYAYWFMAQCIRDSACGGIRAPETLSETPGFSELFWQLLRIFFCLAVCAAPAFSYNRFAGRIDWPFWVLVGCGIFLYLMSILAVVMFDSLEGLRPGIIFPSILITFFPYCGLIMLIAAIMASPVLLMIIFWMFFPLYPFVKAFLIYLLMVSAHLLGRFYFKYQEKLNWAV